MIPRKQSVHPKVSANRILEQINEEIGRALDGEDLEMESEQCSEERVGCSAASPYYSKRYLDPNIMSDPLSVAQLHDLQQQNP